MSKKSVPGRMTEEGTWRDGEDDPPDAFSNEQPSKRDRNAPGKPSRQRIEEYFERKRLAETLDEELGEDFFRA